MPRAMLWLPEPDLAATSLRVIANGVAIGAGHLILGRFLLSPGVPERRIMPLPRADRHFRLLVFFGIASPILLTTAVAGQHAAGPGPVAGLFTLVGIAVTLFKVVVVHRCATRSCSAHPGIIACSRGQACG
jgi:hypothetical protein